jgi:hypothetical protein
MRLVVVKPLVAVVVKRSRLSQRSQLNFHSYKCFGGVLNPNVNGYYIRRNVGQHKDVVMEKLRTIINQQGAVINV